MSTSEIERRTNVAVAVHVDDARLIVDLSDGRSISAPLAWFPRLARGTKKERADWRLIGGGLGIHWPQLDEDISVDNLLAGSPSGEGQQSLQKWLDQRAAARPRRGRRK